MPQALLRFSLHHYCSGRRAFGNHHKAIHSNLFHDLQIHHVANVGRGGRNRLAKFQVNRRAIAQGEFSGRRGSGRSSVRRYGRCVIHSALSGGLHSLWLWRLGAGLVLQQQKALHRHITDLAFGCAHTEVQVIPSGDLYLLSALQRRAHIQCGHGTVEIHIAAPAWTFHLTYALRLGERWKYQAKKCGCVLGPRYHACTCGFRRVGHPALLSHREMALADKKWNCRPCIKRYGGKRPDNQRCRGSSMLFG